MRRFPAMRRFLIEYLTFHHLPLNLPPATMPPKVDHEELKVEEAMALLKNNLGMKATKAARQTRASYPRLLRRLKGVPPSNTRGGHNKKLSEPEDDTLKDYLLMC